MNTQISQIIFFTRPWQVHFHIKLAECLVAKLGHKPIRFITFFSLAKEQVEAAGYECIYMPDELRKVTGNEISDEKFSEIDRNLYESQGANFNLMLQSERFIPQKGNEALMFGRKHLAVLDLIITDNTLLISTVPDHFVYWLAGALANCRNGAFFSFSACGLPPGRVMALKSMWKAWNVPFEGDAEAFLEECKSSLYSPSIPGNSRIEYQNPQIPPPLYKRLMQRYHEIRCDEKDTKAGSYFPGSKLLSLQTLKNRFPQSWFKYQDPLYDVNNDGELSNLNGSYCYFPLHVEPESTILMWSPWLRDQIEACRLVSQALPVGWKLLVKEHIGMKGDRTLEYYQKLKSIPNVVLVSPYVSALKINLVSKITITLTGTATLEAALLGKPSIALGRPPALGMLFAGDISETLSLNRLFEKFHCSEYNLNLQDWISWISGTFKAKIVPVFKSDGTLATPDDEDNIHAYANYIDAALKY